MAPILLCSSSSPFSVFWPEIHLNPSSVMPFPSSLLALQLLRVLSLECSYHSSLNGWHCLLIDLLLHIPLAHVQSIFHTAPRAISSKHMSEHVTALFKIFQSFFIDLWIKTKFLKMGYKVCHTLAGSTRSLSPLFSLLRSFCLQYRSTLFSLNHLYTL